MRWKWVLGIGAALAVATIVTSYALLASYDFNRLKPRIIKAVKDATGRELTLGGDIRLKIGLRPVLVAGKVELANAAWGSRPVMAGIKRFEVQVALLPMIRGEVEIRKLFLVGPDILVETDKSGRSNLSFEKGVVGPVENKGLSNDGDAKLPLLIFKEVRIEQGRLTYRDGRSGRTLAMRLETLTAVATGREGPINLSLKGAYNSKAFEVAGTLGSLGAFMDTKEAWPLKLKVGSGHATVNVEGTIRDCLNARGIDLSINAEGKTLVDFAGPAGVTGVPALGPLKVSAGVTDPGAGQYRFSRLKVILGDMDIAGSVEVALSGKRPRMRAELTSRSLDLRSLFPAQGREKSGTPGHGKVFPDDPLPLDVLKLADAEIRVRAGRVLLPRMAMKDLDLDMTLEEGRLVIRPLTSVIGGGDMACRLDLRPAGRKALLKLTLRIDHLDLGCMLRELGLKDIVEGDLKADIDLMCRGGSVASMMAGLNGKAIMIMGNGRISNNYINLLGGDIGSGISQLLNPLKRVESHTEFNCFVTRFDIREGLAKSTALVFDTPSMSVVGDGAVNLKTEALDLSLKPSPKKGLGISGLGRLSMSLGELAKPFRLGGTLAEPSLSLDPTHTAITIGKMVGGVALFGPLGIAAALASGDTGGENPCLKAIEEVEKRDRPAGDKKEEEKGLIEQATEGIGGALKRLFSD